MPRRIAMVGRGAPRTSEVTRLNQTHNPRPVTRVVQGMTPRFSKQKPSQLSWRRGANVPRSGRFGIGRPGIVDPGGYIRAPRTRNYRIGQDFITRQQRLIPHFSNVVRFNNRYRQSDFNRWPGGLRPGPGWVNLGYYNRYCWDSRAYPASYFAPSGFCPTPYVFLTSYGTFWQPGTGFANYLPYGYNAPITVAVQEIVPIYDLWGNIVSYEPQTFYYNAYWDPNVQAYGFYDYRGEFHWLTFPWLNTWASQQAMY